VTIKYHKASGTGGPYSYGPYSIDASKSRAWYLPDVGLPSDGLYSAVVTSNGQPIGGISNGINVTIQGDGFTSYNGHNR
jgi:hypothetical protein